MSLISRSMMVCGQKFISLLRAAPLTETQALEKTYHMLRSSASIASVVMDYKKLQNTSTVDILSNLYKDYRPNMKRKDVYEVERLISKREGIEVSKQINIKVSAVRSPLCGSFSALGRSG